jgi:hypothetical protein
MTDTTQTDTTHLSEERDSAEGARAIGVRWLDTPPTRLQTAAAFGVPFARGTVESTAGLTLSDETGETVPAQFWPTATWPDGSLKWAGVAVARPASGYVVTDAGGAADAPGSADAAAAAAETAAETATESLSVS